MSRFLTIRGIPFPNATFFTRENIEGTMDYLPRDGDIIITSYPKTGTTWLNYIVLQILSKGQSFPSFDDCQYKETPQMEIVGPDAINNLTGVRKYKHHYRYDMMKKNPKAKILYIYRNPEDTVISFYHFVRNAYAPNIDLDEFLDGFLVGNVEFGGYFEHVLSFLAHKNDENLLLISYEKLLINPKKGILQIAKFLGEDYYRNLLEDESLMNEILEQTSFDNMKKRLIVNLPIKKAAGNNPINFFRKGVVGDGKTSLSPDQLTRLREKAKEVIKDEEVLRDWFTE